MKKKYMQFMNPDACMHTRMCAGVIIYCLHLTTETWIILGPSSPSSVTINIEQSDCNNCCRWYQRSCSINKGKIESPNSCFQILKAERFTSM